MARHVQFRLTTAFILTVLVAVLAAWAADHIRLVRAKEALRVDMEARLLEAARLVHHNATSALNAEQRQVLLERQLEELQKAQAK